MSIYIANIIKIAKIKNSKIFTFLQKNGQRGRLTHFIREIARYVNPIPNVVVFSAGTLGRISACSGLSVSG